MVKELTKQERRRIYLEAAKFFAKGDDKRLRRSFGRIDGFCDYLTYFEEKSCNYFTEYKLFMPKNCFLYWFTKQEDRIIALLLAAELTK